MNVAQKCCVFVPKHYCYYNVLFTWEIKVKIHRMLVRTYIVLQKCSRTIYYVVWTCKYIDNNEKYSCSGYMLLFVVRTKAKTSILLLIRCDSSLWNVYIYYIVVRQDIRANLPWPAFLWIRYVDELVSIG